MSMVIIYRIKVVSSYKKASLSVRNLGFISEITKATEKRVNSTRKYMIYGTHDLFVST